MPLRSSLPLRLALAVSATVVGVECPGQLPADAGQLWKTYDIGPFVAQAGAGSERHVVDWILQDTGYSAWHGSVAASLSADATTLRCYHTAAMQARVADVVTRFVGEAATPHRFSVRVFGMDGPEWRAEARPALAPIPAVTPGIQAWICPREQAAMLVSRLRARGDCRELPTGPVLAGNGVPAMLVGGRKQPYVQDVAPRLDAWPGWTTLAASCDEGFALDVQPLMTLDGVGVEAVVRCRIDQIERLVPVSLAAPIAGGQRVRVEVPQVAAVRVGERFRWPANQVLLIGLGLVPWPVPAQNVVPAAFTVDDKRSDVIVVVEPRLSGVR